MTKHSTRTNPLARLAGRLTRPARPAQPTPPPADVDADLEPTVKNLYPFVKYGD